MDILRSISFLILEFTVRQTDRLNVISHRILGSTQDKQMDNLCFISPSNLNLRKTDMTNYVSFYPLYWNPSKTDGQSTVIGIYARQTNYVSFHSAYRDPRQTEGQTKLHFAPHIGIKVRQVDKLFSPLIFESTQERRTNNISFHPSCWHFKTNRRTNYVSFHSSCWYPNYISFHPLYWNLSKTDRKYLTFHP